MSDILASLFEIINEIFEIINEIFEIINEAFEIINEIFEINEETCYSIFLLLQLIIEKCNRNKFFFRLFLLIVRK
jgi:hypothetical protein